MKLECSLIDVCLPDYFQGSSRAYVQVPVDGSTTFRQLREALHAEVSAGYIGGDNPLTRDDSGAEPSALGSGASTAGDAWFKAAHAAINRDVKPVHGRTRYAFHDLQKDSDDDCCEFVYAYFVFVEA
jgi:hypothetical protein